MSKYIGPKLRLFRRLGLRLPTHSEISQNDPTVKKAYPPGMHGPKGSFAKKSEYGRQLAEKQKARVLFNITERALKNYYLQATKKDGITGDELLTLLENRLDNVIFRSGIATTRYQARQMVNHGLIILNGQKVRIPSIQVRVGDKFEMVPSKKDSAIFKANSLKKIKAPKWLEVDLANLSGTVLRKPEASELEQAVQASLIVEFYSK